MANDWMGARSATEHPAEDKAWTPKGPPPLFISIISQLLKLLPEASAPTARDLIKGNRQEQGSSVSSAHPTPASELTTTSISSVPKQGALPDIGLPDMQSPYKGEAAPFKSKTNAADGGPRPYDFPPAYMISPVVKIGYAEYPSVFIVQSEDFQPHVQVRRSSQPGVHIYGHFPLQVDNRPDEVAKHQGFHIPEPLPEEPSLYEEAQKEGLVNLYVRQRQPTVFFHYNGRSAAPGTKEDESNASLPRICIDTTSLWWPSIQCTFSSNQSPQSTGGFNTWNYNSQRENAHGISISGPIKPLIMDLPY